MEKKRIRIRYFWCVVICFLLVSLTGVFASKVNAEQADKRVTVVDDAAVLMEEEADWLESVAIELAEKKDWSVIVATCQDAGGKSAQKVCEENFNRYTAGDDGISCLVDLDNREIYLATAGEAISYLDDSRINKILDEAYEAVSKEDYAQCLYLMILRTGECCDLGMVSSGSAEDPGISLIKKLGTIFGTLLVLVILLIPGMKKKHLGRMAGRPRIRRRNVYQRNARPNRTSVSRGSRSRTTVHRGAGGRRFGGGGRKF